MKKLFITLLTAITVTACSGDFLDQSPTDALPSDEIGKPENALKLFNGAWRYMFDTYFTYANPGFATVFRQDDMMGDDVVAYPDMYGFTASYQFSDVQNITDYRTRALWTLQYKVIDNCNQAIAIVSTKRNTVLDRARGMAYALRAYVYFNLVQHYQFTYAKDHSALCVPVYTEPTGPATQAAPKSTVEQIYTLIVNDLTVAAGLLQDQSRVAKYEPDANVVNGLLARVYLVMGEWDKAVSAAQAAREGYSLMSAADYASGFNDAGNVEWIWGHLQTPEQSVASYLFNYLDVVSPQSYYYSFMADPYFKELFTDPDDIRLNLFEWIRDGYLGYKKFLFRNNNTADIVLMRSAEMYLIEAEAKARSNSYTTEDAIVPLNTLRSARGMSAFSTAGKTNDEVIEEILKERRRELWGEGFSLTDILRLQIPVVRKAYSGNPVECRQIPDGDIETFAPQGHWTFRFPNDAEFTANSPYYLYAIPETESNANPNLNN